MPHRLAIEDRQVVGTQLEPEGGGEKVACHLARPVEDAHASGAQQNRECQEL